MPLSMIFQLYRGVSFIGGWKWNTMKNHRPVASQWQTLSHKVYRVHSAMREIGTHNLVMIGTDCIGSCKFNYNAITTMMTAKSRIWKTFLNQRLPGACNRSPGSKLLSITTHLHCGVHLGGWAQLPDTILEKDHPMTIPSKFGSNWATGSRQDGFYVNFP